MHQEQATGVCNCCANETEEQRRVEEHQLKRVRAAHVCNKEPTPKSQLHNGYLKALPHDASMQLIRGQPQRYQNFIPH